MLSAMETLELSAEQRMVQDAIRDICDDFDADYWRQKDEQEEYPHEFVDTLAENGWLGALIPEEYGGAGMSTAEVVVIMEEVAANGGGFSGAQAIHGAIYNTPAIVNYGSKEMKEELLPKMAAGDISIQSMGLTEPNAGSDSTSIETVAERDDDEYVINGQKIWISRVDATDFLILIARTTPRDEVEKRTQGISMFLIDLEDAREQGAFEARQIPKTVSGCVHSYELWFEDLRVPVHRLIGEEGDGFYQILDGLNEERIVIAAECIGLGEAALEAGVNYANEREVFGSKIGANQAIQHPLAEAYAHVQAAKHVVYNAAELTQTKSQQEVGAQANMAKYLAAQSAFDAADAAVQTHGGFGVAREYDVERFMREARLTRLVPITQELVLNYLGEKVLGMSRSY
ncbi:acyl-CoA dehydrogenase family protein [Haladaptatus sp. NG-WS-4]